MNPKKIKIDLDYLSPNISFIYPLYSPEGEKILEARVVLSRELIKVIRDKYGNVVYYNSEGQRAVIPPYRIKIAYNTSREIMEEIAKSDKISKASFHNAEKIVEDILKDLSDASVDAIDLIKDLKSYDEYLYNHSVNVGVLTALFATRLKQFSDEELRSVTLGAYLHDIGEKRIDKQLLNKEDRLDVTEMQKLKRHPQLGYEIISKLGKAHPIVLQSILFHHEKYNHRGYYELPYENLPIFPKMLSICDIFDALTSSRPYRKEPYTPSSAIKSIFNSVNSHFDFSLVQRFINLMCGIINNSQYFYNFNDLCELNTMELALIKGFSQKDMLRPPVMVFCKFLREGNRIRVKYYEKSFLVNLEKDSERNIIKMINNPAQVKSIISRLQEKDLQ